MRLAKISRRFSFAAPRPSLSWAATRLQWALVAGVLIALLRGVGRPPQLLLFVLVLPSLRLLADREYRSAWRATLGVHWSRIEAYSQQDSEPPWQSVFALVVLPIVFLNLSTNRFLASGDSWPVIPTAVSLVSEGNLELSERLPQAPPAYLNDATGLPYCVTRTARGIYSLYPAGMTVFAAPVCMAATLCGADLSSPRVQERLERFTAAWIGGACLGLLFLIAVRLQNARSAAIATLFLASGSAMISTVGHGLWQHGGIIFWSLSTFWIEVHWRGRPTPRMSIVQGMCLGSMLACRPSAAIIAALVGGWVGLRSCRRGVLVAVGALLGYLPWAVYYARIYQSILGPAHIQTAAAFWDLTEESVAGVLFSPACGLFVYQPWLLLVALEPFLWFRERQSSDTATQLPGGWKIVCATAIALQVLLVAAWICWWGGDCWGSRLMADVVPFGALLCLRPIQYLRQRRGGIAVLLAIGLIAAYMHMSVVHLKADITRRHVCRTDWTQAPFLPRHLGVHWLRLE